MASISLSIASISSPSLPLISSATIRPRRSVIAASATASSGDWKARAWWAPLFRSIIPDPDGEAKGVEAGSGLGSGSEGKTGRARLTAEKARELRRQLRESESWHDGFER
ncbi:hypothetical protein DsansV1_C14g0131761 [Dioscorea sansibarensis]